MTVHSIGRTPKKKNYMSIDIRDNYYLLRTDQQLKSRLAHGFLPVPRLSS